MGSPSGESRVQCCLSTFINFLNDRKESKFIKCTVYPGWELQITPRRTGPDLIRTLKSNSMRGQGRRGHSTDGQPALPGWARVHCGPVLAAGTQRCHEAHQEITSGGLKTSQGDSRTPPAVFLSPRLHAESENDGCEI